MTLVMWLTLVGGISLLVGLIAAIGANHYQTRQTLLLAPSWKRDSLFANPRAYAAACFWVGLALTAAGIVMQTAGALLALRQQCPSP